MTGRGGDRGLWPGEEPGQGYPGGYPDPHDPYAEYGVPRYRGRRERSGPPPEDTGPFAGGDPLTDPWPGQGSRHRGRHGTGPTPAVGPDTEPPAPEGGRRGRRRKPETDPGSFPERMGFRDPGADTGDFPARADRADTGEAPDSGADTGPFRARSRPSEEHEHAERRPGRRRKSAAPADDSDPLGFAALGPDDGPDPLDEPLRHRPLDFDAVPVRRKGGRRGATPARRRPDPVEDEGQAGAFGDLRGDGGEDDGFDAFGSRGRGRAADRSGADDDGDPDRGFDDGYDGYGGEPEDEPEERGGRRSRRARRRAGAGSGRSEDDDYDDDDYDDGDADDEEESAARSGGGRRRRAGKAKKGSAGRGRKSGRRDRGDRGGRRPGKRGLAVAAAVLLVAGTGVAGRTYLFPADYDGAGSSEVEVVVPEGASGAAIGELLAEEDVVASSRSFVNALDGGEEISPGTYRMRSQMSAESAVAALLDPDSRIDVRVTVREGVRASGILHQLSEEVGIDREELDAAYADTEALGLPPYAEEGPEGYLFPDTYAFAPDDSAEEILSQMVDRYKATAEDPSVDVEGRAGDVGLEPNEVMAVASIVQAETGSAEDMPKIAAVVYNRLEQGMELGMDSTCFYVIGEHGIALTNAQLEQCKAAESEYATYGRTGLPAGPIVSPGADAIEAALSPSQGDWLYFVATDPEAGTTEFAETYDEFLVLKERFQQNWQEG
ncbi:endolytic transglycosylase MltG [Nocardiopsis coralliicola]